MKLILTFVYHAVVWADGPFSRYNDHNVCSNQMLLTRTQRERGKYLGCFQEKELDRIFRGYIGHDANLTIDKCIDLCTFYRFVYAGFLEK